VSPRASARARATTKPTRDEVRRGGYRAARDLPCQPRRPPGARAEQSLGPQQARAREHGCPDRRTLDAQIDHPVELHQRAPRLTRRLTEQQYLQRDVGRGAPEPGHERGDVQEAQREHHAPRILPCLPV
jgi:hypothetical protein